MDDVRSGISSNTRSTFDATRGAEASCSCASTPCSGGRRSMQYALLSPLPRNELQDEKAVPPGSEPRRRKDAS